MYLNPTSYSKLIISCLSAIPLLLMGFKLMAGAVASCALIGVAVGVGIIYGSLLISIGRNPSQRDELLRYAFIGFSLVEVSGLIGLVISLLLLFGFDRLGGKGKIHIITKPF